MTVNAAVVSAMAFLMPYALAGAEPDELDIERFVGTCDAAMREAVRGAIDRFVSIAASKRAG